MDPFFFVYKEAGITSNRLVQSLKKKLHLKKLGHTGTLDLFAEGLMILPSGKSCNFSSLFLEMDKTYEGTLALGVSTDSGDPEGVVLESLPRERVETIWEKDWEMGRVLESRILATTGHMEQEAPVISALKQGGKRLSDLHRKGLPIIPKKRSIYIESVEILELNPFSTRFRIRVSSGTYIRKIAMDWGKELGFPISLKKLIRTSIGEFHLSESKKWEDIRWEDGKSAEEVVDFPRIVVEERFRGWVESGRKPPLDVSSLEPLLDHSHFFLTSPSGEIWAWGRKKKGNEYEYNRVFVSK